MATEPEFIFISPRKISPEFQSYAKQLLGYKSAEIITPEKKSDLICEDLLSDTKSLNILVEKAKLYKKITLISYSASAEFYKLKETLVELGLEVYTPETPEIDCAWTVNFFGSKSGIRQLAQQSRLQEPDFIMPEGIICVGREVAANIAANKYIKQKGVVIKTNKGSGGSGILIFRNGDLPQTYRECVAAILRNFNSDKYWDNFPIVIEDLINIKYGIGGGFPSIEFKIQKNGRIDMLYYCLMEVTQKGEFIGLDINDDLINDRISTKIIDTGYFIAEKFSTAGYRGHFDIDMIASKNNQIYVSESNTRNSGGTDVYRVVYKLLGKDFMDDYYIISRSHFSFPHGKSIKFSSLLDQLDTLLYDHKEKRGVLINSENILKSNELIYVIIGRSKKQAYEIQGRMIELLQSGSYGVSINTETPIQRN